MGDVKEDEASVEETLKATGLVLRVIPQLASLAVGFTAVAYLVGWLESSAYYGDLGATFALPMLTASQVLKTGIWLVSLVALFALISVYLLTQGEIGQKGLRRWGIFHLSVAALCYGAPALFGKSLDPSTALLLSGTASVFWALSLSAALGEIIACLRGKSTWGRYEVFILYIAAAFGFLYAPRVMGEVRAELAVTPPSPLKVASLAAAATAEDWRLVGLVGDHMLLMVPAEKKKDRKFRLVQPQDIVEISFPPVRAGVAAAPPSPDPR